MTGRQSDILVIGSGIAGLSLALKAAEYGSVALVTKKQSAESNTNYAQGGVAAVISAADSFDLHIADTLDTGVGLCHRDTVETVVREGPTRVRELMNLGVDFTRSQEGLDLGREGGHSRNRIVHVRDRSGAEIERALLHAVASHPAISVYEHHFAVDLITEHQTGIRRPDDRSVHCWGAYVLDVRQGNVVPFTARKTVLCSGGLGQVYLHTTNPPIATGDGVAMAYRAGAQIADMEFIQFHPTSLYDSGSPAFLISEAIRGFGGVLKTRDGQEFVQRYDPRGSLAPRDIVARAIDAELKRRGDHFVLLDLRHLPAENIRKSFPHIYETCRTRAKLDITQEPIPVVPAAHYACGGIVTDLHGRTSIADLCACGEVAMTGLHGANRLASNSLLEAVVFSHRVALDIGAGLSKNEAMPDVPSWDDSGTFDAKEWVLIEHDRREIQELMWDYVGIVRSDERLERARTRLLMIQTEVEAFYRRTKVVEPLVELRNLATVAMLIVQSALLRRESRGLHYTTDYPGRDDQRYLHDTVLTRGAV
ncbi:MAG TPA: L-aspartate oxidase [Bacteroidota bacterium]|nr:L-aspartate oxidase [Bacteroidota bacterium]